MSDVAERVKKIVIEHLSVEPDKVTESARASSMTWARTVSIRSSWSWPSKKSSAAKFRTTKRSKFRRSAMPSRFWKSKSKQPELQLCSCRVALLTHQVAPAVVVVGSTQSIVCQ